MPGKNSRLSHHVIGRVTVLPGERQQLVGEVIRSDGRRCDSQQQFQILEDAPRLARHRTVLALSALRVDLRREYAHHQSPAIRAGGMVFCSGMVAEAWHRSRDDLAPATS